MCFERTEKRVEPFHIGYKAVRKCSDGKYYPVYSVGVMNGGHTALSVGLPLRQWLDEMPWRDKRLLLKQRPKVFVGWHVMSTLEQANAFAECHASVNGVVLRVECYGLNKPYGLGHVDNKPAGRFQFMKILEEIK